jgi:hypothetical protein
MLLLPLALLVYLIAMPVFALFWIIEWALPLDGGNLQSEAEDRPLPQRSTPAQDSTR